MKALPPQTMQFNNQLYGYHAHQNDSNKTKNKNASTISYHITRGSVAKHKKKHERQPAMKILRNTILQEIVTEIENECMKAQKKWKHWIKTRISQPWITRVIIDHCRHKNENSVVDLVDGERNEVGDGIKDEWEMSMTNEQVSGENEMWILFCVWHMMSCALCILKVKIFVTL